MPATHDTTYHPDLAMAMRLTKRLVDASKPEDPESWMYEHMPELCNAWYWVRPAEVSEERATEETREFPLTWLNSSSHTEFMHSVTTTRFGARLFVASLKHRRPYEGCFWEWQDYLGEVTGLEDKTYTIRLMQLYAPKGRGRRQPYFSDIWEDDSIEAAEFYHLEEAGFAIRNESLPQAHYLLSELYSYDLEWQDDAIGRTSEWPLMMTGYSGNGGVGINAGEWLSETGFYEAMRWDRIENTWIWKEEAVPLWPGNHLQGPFGSKYNRDLEEVWINGEPTGKYVYAPHGATWED